MGLPMSAQIIQFADARAKLVAQRASRAERHNDAEVAKCLAAVAHLRYLATAEQYVNGPLGGMYPFKDDAK